MFFFYFFYYYPVFFSLAVLSGPTLLISFIAYCNNLNHFYFQDSPTLLFRGKQEENKVLVLLLIDD